MGQQLPDKLLKRTKFLGSPTRKVSLQIPWLQGKHRHLPVLWESYGMAMTVEEAPEEDEQEDEPAEEEQPAEEEEDGEDEQELAPSEILAPVPQA